MLGISGLRQGARNSRFLAVFLTGSLRAQPSQMPHTPLSDASPRISRLDCLVACSLGTPC